MLAGDGDIAVDGKCLCGVEIDIRQHLDGVSAFGFVSGCNRFCQGLVLNASLYDLRHRRSRSVLQGDILVNLDYDKNKLCKCLPEYTVDTEFGTGYGINLTEGYARCDKGQADLTKEQIDKLKEIIIWAKDKV